MPIISIREAIIHQVSSMWPALLYLLASVILQNLLCRFLILQDPQLNTAIDNRRVYNLVAYFFFFNVSSQRFYSSKNFLLEHFRWRWFTSIAHILRCDLWAAQHSTYGYTDPFVRLRGFRRWLHSLCGLSNRTQDAHTSSGS